MTNTPTNSPTDSPITVLLIEDIAADAALIQAALADSGDRAFRIKWVVTLADALKCLGRKQVEVILLDLALSNGQGIAAFDQLIQAAPNALILVLSGTTDEEIVHQAMQRGAHDYFSKAHIDAHWLPRALRYVIERQTARVALGNSEARFRAISDASPLGIFVADVLGGCVYTNAAYHKISGLSLDQTLGTNWSMAIHPEDRERVLAEWRIAAQSLEPFQTEYRFQQEDDSVVWVRVNSAAMRDDQGIGRKLFGLVQTVEDVSQRKAAESVMRAAEEALFEEKERAQVTLNSIGDAVLTTNLAGDVTYLNKVAEGMTGWSRKAALGRPLAEVFKIIDGKSRAAAENPAQRAINEDQTVGLAANSVLIRRDGLETAIEDSSAPIHNREGHVIGAVLVFHDVSESRAVALRMAHLAQHDFLTGLPNRVLLNERCSQAIGQANRHKKQVGLLFLDLDFFKRINDSLGHAIGDLLLQSVAERLVAGVRATDTVSRQGGDEFVILLAEIEQQRDATYVAEKLLAAFASPHRIEGHELYVSLSIGISIYPDDSDSVDSVMQNADTAMFHAKADGRNKYQFFRPDMNLSAARIPDRQPEVRPGFVPAHEK
jgi:diguanylate cyclase (GGDEF)-like protein/PAS domain S-box-containing protein